MKLEKGVISNTQLMYLALCYMETMVMTINFVYSISKQDAWLAILVAFVIVIPVLLGYTAIAKKYPGSNLVQINDAVFGPYVGKFFSALYIWFFFELIIHYAYLFNSFWITFIMTETPRAAFVIMLILVSAMAVRSGIEVIARCGMVFSIIVALMVISVAVLLIPNYEGNHFLPVFELSPKDLVQSVHCILTIPFCDIVAFLMILPYTEDNKKIRKPILLATGISTALLLIMVFASIATAGIRMINFTSVTFAVTREIDIGEVLTRLDVLVAVTILLTVFIKVTIYYYVTVLGLAQMFKLNSYKTLVVPIGVLVIAIATNLYSSDMEQVYAAQFIWPFNASVFEFVLPALTLAVIVIRKLIEKGKAEA